jgi:hypothetical protein
MSAPKGNRFWEVRSSHGRKPIFAEPESLWEAATEYFEWVEANPLMEDRIIAFQGAATHEPVAKMRAMTIDGLLLFLDIARSTWDRYKTVEGFSDVTTRIESVIRSQKFAGAAADLLNANIIARDLGLADRQEHTGKDGGAIKTEDVTDPRAAARRIAFALAQGLAAKETPESA